MKEEAFLRRRFSLCPPSSTPQKLSRNLLVGGEHELDVGPGKDMEPHGPSPTRDEGPPTPGSATKVPPAEYRLCNGSDRECVSPTAKVSKKEALKAQKESYRREKKRATRQLLSALTDPSVVIMADSLKIRGTLKSWTKLWCVLKPGVLLIYKTPKVGQWVGTVLLHCCELIERPSKKDGFCFKLFHPLDQSVWAVKGPKGESVGSITQPLPSSYLIFRAASESDGRCWLDALELALRCSSLLRLSACKQGRDGEPGSSPDGSPSSLCGLPASGAVHDQDLFPLNGSSLENDAFSDKSERENAEESDNETHDHSRKTESGSDQSEAPAGPGRRGTTYVVQDHEELGERGEASQVETVSDENKSLVWVLLKQLRPGMDLSRVALPTFVLEPRSFLNKLSDYYCHADLLSRAALEEDAYSRIKLVLRWYLSGFYKKPKGIKKPYNPVLGETFRCCWFHPQTNSRTFYIAEQVSHHPPVSAFHVSNRKDGFCISGSITAKSRFYGNSLSALLDGKATLTFLNRAEDYSLTMPYAHCKELAQGHGLHSWDTWAQQLWFPGSRAQARQSWCLGLDAAMHMGSSWSRDDPPGPGTIFPDQGRSSRTRDAPPGPGTILPDQGRSSRTRDDPPGRGTLLPDQGRSSRTRDAPPGPGIQAVSPALAGGFSATGPPGKPRKFLFELQTHVTKPRPGMREVKASLTPSEAKGAQSCPILCDPVGYTVHGILVKHMRKDRAPPSRAPATHRASCFVCSQSHAPTAFI
ncbi:oxysterol-binding protein-related protein 5 isoform X5 [Ovis canadensis]|uniref:oxysterol-binding protein-related protein 5 isoform X5 n=1 Tax=Ovis canadensis TaxID=37174 RepID=UPI003751BEB8